MIPNKDKKVYENILVIILLKLNIFISIHD